MDSATILYFGMDECLRVPVLQAAGFHVARCASLLELERALEEEPEIAAVLFEEGRDRPADAVAEQVRQRSKAALVLFRYPAGESSEANFDLVIDPAKFPARWLQQLAEIILARMAPRWAEVARELQARRCDLPAEDSSVRGYGIQPERRKCP